jgi:hypothetical protein
MTPRQTSGRFPSNAARDLLASYGWKREGQNRSVAHGECGRPDVCGGLDSTTESYVTSWTYATLISLPINVSASAKTRVTQIAEVPSGSFSISYPMIHHIERLRTEARNILDPIWAGTCGGGERMGSRHRPLS